ncbi:site-specific integrase (plasmid) [Mycobacterium avium subsp. hominissuis]|nr:site-specific integrase [Mycobacterium avium subsp. hominissuis]
MWPLRIDQPGRQVRDRHELLTTLLSGPSVDPVFRDDVLRFPPLHPVFGWRCVVTECEAARANGNELCNQHNKQWLRHRDRGGNRPEFVAAATPIKVALPPDERMCRICPERPARRSENGLCLQHSERFRFALQRHPELTLDDWLPTQHALPGYGECRVVCCPELAQSPLGLCRWHGAIYKRVGRPGGAHLPGRWLMGYEAKGKRAPLRCEDRAAFDHWCATVEPHPVRGQVNLLGLRPLVAAEIRWGMYRHTEGRRARWDLQYVQALANACREHDLVSLVDLDLDVLDAGKRSPRKHVAREMLGELRLVYFTRADTREAGFLETEHFGIRYTNRGSHFNLRGASQPWLRNLLWDYLADLLQAPSPPATAGPIDGLRRGVVELSAFLETDAVGGGHDPTQLGEVDMQRFVADQRHRVKHGLPSLGIHRGDGQPSTVTTVTSSQALNSVRRILRWALDTGAADTLAIPRSFIVAAPYGGTQPSPARRPFPDHVAQQLADEQNLQALAAYDPNDVGIRDAWTIIIATGRRANEVLKLRLDCTGRHNDLPLLWHDQTKVGNYDTAIRIPESVYELIETRRRKSIAKYVQHHGHEPAPRDRHKMALFPSNFRNSDGTASMGYPWYSRSFRLWVDSLDLGGNYVTHQARHTLATKLLRHGAPLHHIQRYLGQISPRMAERYAKASLSDIEDILQHVWVAGPAAPHPGEVLSAGTTTLTRTDAQALALDLSRRSTPAEGGFCTFQPVVHGHACPWNLDCHNCDKFVLSGADLLYWRRKREQWRSIAERAPDDATADYLHQVFEPTNKAIDGLEKALSAVGLLDEALALDMRRPQDYLNRMWATAFRAQELAQLDDADDTVPTEELA